MRLEASAGLTDSVHHVYQPPRATRRGEPGYETVRMEWFALGRHAGDDRQRADPRRQHVGGRANAAALWSEEEFRIMTVAWSPDELERIGGAEELQIATKRADGTLRRAVPIWVVRAGGQVYVRTWYRRDSGWFGHAVGSRRARIRVPGLEADVAIEDVGGDDGGAARERRCRLPRQVRPLRRNDR